MNAKQLGAQPAHPHNSGNTGFGLGLTKRELFAAMAMQGTLADNSPSRSARPDEIAEYAMCCADALLAELAKEQP